MKLEAPTAQRVAHTHRAHDHEREDPYHWLRDDERSDPRILAHLREENRYADKLLSPLGQRREALYEEILARIPKSDATVPYLLNGHWYYRRFEEGREYAVYCRKEGDLNASEVVLLDGNERAEGHAYYAVKGLTVSDDSRILAFAEDVLSRRIYTTRFKNLETGEILPDRLEGTSGSIAWARDNRTVFYVRKEEGSLREFQVWRHVLGTPAEDDQLVFEETDPEFHLSIMRSRSRDYVLIGSYQTKSHEYLAVDADAPTSAPRVVLRREREHEYDVDHWNGRFYIRTNWRAVDFRLMSVEPSRSDDKAAWREELPAAAAVHLRDFAIFDGFLAVSERAEGTTRVRVFPWTPDRRPDRPAGHEVRFAEAVRYVSFGANPDPRSSILRLQYESLTTPGTVYDYETANRSLTLRKRDDVGPDFDPEAYESERLSVSARDGTSIPISLVYRRGLDRSSPSPLVLYGYGAYGISSDPTFRSARLSLLDRGVVFAIAHIRGGQEMGRAWYEEGRLFKKLNSFHDFIDCAEGLVQRGWTTPDRMAGWGGSAGGLLVGAVANMRPDLFDVIVAQVPFVDVVTTMLDETIPLTTFEYDEWGNPNDKAFYEYMLSYSPYDNVRPASYPNMLVLTGLHDSQVQYWEPAKWVARLRLANTGAGEVVFRTNLEAGHGGASGRFRRHEETALIYAYLLDRLGVDA